MSLKIVAPNSQEQNYQDYKESFILRSLARELGFTAAQAVHTLVGAEKNHIDKLQNEIPYMTSQWNMIPYGESYKGFPTEKTIQV